jgi:3-dehydroquinate synthase class II
MGDGKTTKYLCELEAGDEVCVYNSITNESKAVAIGRLKVEMRPCLIVGLETPGGAVSQVFLQQAETVRLGDEDGQCVRVTDLSSEEKVNMMLRSTTAGTHIGQAYSGKVVEKCINHALPAATISTIAFSSIRRISTFFVLLGF